jgi:hypothetical protein
MRRVTTVLLAAGPEVTSGTATCSSCRRTTPTIAYSRSVKCGHCSRRIHDDGLGVLIDGDAFHRSCWQVLLSDERIRVSRTLGRRSLELIDQARRRLKA